MNRMCAYPWRVTLATAVFALSSALTPVAAGQPETRLVSDTVALNGAGHAPASPTTPAVAGGAAAASTAGGSTGSASAAGSPAVTFRVSAQVNSGQLITVPVNQGVLVDFSVPLKEIRVANGTVAEATATAPTQLLISGKSFGTTQLIAWTEGGQQHVFTIACDLELDRLQASIRTVAPRAGVRATGVLNSVLLTGTAPDTETAEKIAQIAQIYSPQVVNHIKVAGTQQVLLRCTVAEVNRTATRQLGFNGWLGGENFRDVFAVNQIDGINPANIGAAAGANIRQNVPFLTGTDGIPLTGTPQLSLGFPRVQMQVFIQALRENGLLRVMAEPNLVAISGHEASFLAGGEFPIPVPQNSGGGVSITIDYREFGVRLRFTPVVLSESTIRLRVAPEVSEPDFSTAVTLSGFVVPGLTQRRAETTVELGAGQTFAIGGLLSERTRATSRKVPALGDVPVLGQLFSSVRYQQEETELIILVTPELVAPISPNQVAYVPGRNHTPPNDWELYGLGKIEGATPERSRPAMPDGGTWPVKPNEIYGPKAAPKLRGPMGPAGNADGM